MSVMITKKVEQVKAVLCSHLGDEDFSLFEEADIEKLASNGFLTASAFAATEKDLLREVLPGRMALVGVLLKHFASRADFRAHRSLVPQPQHHLLQEMPIADVQGRPPRPPQQQSAVTIPFIHTSFDNAPIEVSMVQPNTFSTSAPSDSGGDNDAQAPNTRKAKKAASSRARRQKLAGTREAGQSRDCWSLEQFRVLADSKKKLDGFMADARGSQQVLGLNDRWMKVSKWCEEGGVKKNPLQCRDKWENVFPKFRRITDWNKNILSGLPTWEEMDQDERRSHGLPKAFNETMYKILEANFGDNIPIDPGPIAMTIASSKQELDDLPSDLGVKDSLDTEKDDANCSGKKKKKIESRRTAGLKRDFQEASVNLIDSLERSQRSRMEEQRKETAKLIALHEREARIQEEQVQALQQSTQQFTDMLAAYLTRNP